MLLEATGLGLDHAFYFSACWVLNGSDYADLAKEAGIPEGHAVQCAIILGYPAAENKFSGRTLSAKGTVNYIK